MLGPPKLRRFDQPITVSLEVLGPADHFSLHQETKPYLSFVRDWTQEPYAAQSAEHRPPGLLHVHAADAHVL